MNIENIILLEDVANDIKLAKDFYENPNNISLFISNRENGKKK